MNKTILAGCAGLALMFLAGASHAGNHKTDLWHCGCNAEGTDLEFSLLSVSTNAGGHRNHMDGHETVCIDLEDNETTFMRTADDCTPGGVSISGVPACDPVPVAEQDCGDEVVLE